MPPPPPDDILFRQVRVVHDRTRRVALQKLQAVLAQLDQRYAGDAGEVAKRLKSLLRAQGASAEAIARVVEHTLSGSRASRNRAVASAISTASAQGARADGETFRAVFHFPRPADLDFATQDDAQAAASARIRGKTSAGRLTLSQRFHTADAQAAARMTEELTRGIRAGDAVTRIADQLARIAPAKVNVPEYVKQLELAARVADATGDTEVFRRAVKEWRGTIERLGQGKAKGPGDFTIRSAGQELVKALAGARGAQIDAAVQRWIAERGRYQMRMVARTETVEAYREMYRQAQADKPWVKGFRWVLSAQHPEPDVCDILANQDLHGLGPGGYPPHAVPENPHPHDLCSLIAIIDEQHFEREEALASGEGEPPRRWESGRTETGQDWLARQPPAFQRALLGEFRAKLLRAGVAVIDHAGHPIPVRDLLQT